MNRRIVTWLVLLVLASCRSYDYQSKVTDQDGLTPPDQFARYGTEQAQAVAIAREYGRAGEGESAEALARQADKAMTYARTLPDVADIDADPLGHRLTIRFKSGWRTAVAPIDDGESGAGTPGVKPAAPGKP
ncbi:MAG: hypothetical protein M3Q93_16105 [Gemmatimonadota bacterium]|nr:hypothetical protein [Gemmatimonadota bacterium]